MTPTGSERRGPRLGPFGPLVLAPLLAGCPIVEDLVGESDDGKDQTEVAGGGEPVLETDRKLTAYIECRDSLVGPVSESWGRYAEHVDDAGNPRRRNRAFIYPVGKASFRICTKVLAEEPEVSPSMPEIERSAAEMVEAAREYAQLSRELNQYFESKGYENDEWAKLSTLHPKLRDAHAQWEKGDSVLELYLDTEKSTNDPKLLEILSADGKDLEYYARALMVSARPLARCVRDPEASKAQCEPSFAAFDSAYGEFDRAYQADRDGADRVFWMSTFAVDAADLHAQMGDHVKRLGDRGRDPEEVTRLYDNLVRDANTLDFDFP